MLIGQKPGGHPVICSWVKGEWFFARIFSFRLFFINRIIRFLTPSSPCILLCCSSRAWRQRLQTRTMDAWWLLPKFWIMEIIDKGLKVPKCVLTLWTKIPQIPQNYSADLPNWPKSLGYCSKKASSGVLSMCLQTKINRLGNFAKKVRDDLNSRPLAHRCYSAFIITAS